MRFILPVPGITIKDRGEKYNFIEFHPGSNTITVRACHQFSPLYIAWINKFIVGSISQFLELTMRVMRIIYHKVDFFKNY